MTSLGSQFVKAADLQAGQQVFLEVSGGLPQASRDAFVAAVTESGAQVFVYDPKVGTPQDALTQLKGSAAYVRLSDHSTQGTGVSSTNTTEFNQLAFSGKFLTYNALPNRSEEIAHSPNIARIHL